MSHEIVNWMKLYEISPSIMLFDDMASNALLDQNEILSKFRRNNQCSLNPIDIVLESIVHVISESISSQTLTSSIDKVLITLEVRDRAIAEVLKFLETNTEQKLMQLHRAWLTKLIEFLKSLSEEEGDLKVDEVLFRVSRRFRISGASAIKSISTVIKP